MQVMRGFRQATAVVCVCVCVCVYIYIYIYIYITWFKSALDDPRINELIKERDNVDKIVAYAKLHRTLNLNILFIEIIQERLTALKFAISLPTVPRKN